MAPSRIERLKACQSLSKGRTESEDIEGWQEAVELETLVLGREGGKGTCLWDKTKLGSKAEKEASGNVSIREEEFRTLRRKVLILLLLLLLLLDLDEEELLRDLKVDRDLERKLDLSRDWRES
ncbi:hypothetical protein RhiirB3_394332 [Rhizophagus irregularis]|nr:hypothetical protein RhiirB3_394332 [Rhizophagus irregularis]